jgi:PAS domain S-box-containing protein
LRAVTNGGASLQAILDCVALPVWVVDHDGLVVLANPAALGAFGYELAELQGRHGHSTVHYKRLDGSPYPAAECPILEPARSGTPVSGDDWFVRRDGSMFPVSYTAVPLELPSGRGVVMTFVDMTAQREAEQGLRERDAILARVAQPVWVVDRRGDFHYVNPAAAAALGYDDPSELVGKPGHDTVLYKYLDGTPFPEEDCPVAQARRAGGDRPGRRELAGAQGRVDHAHRVLHGAVRPPGRPRRGDRVHRHRGPARGRARAPRARRRRRAGRRAAGPRRRIIEAADAARERLTRDLHDGAQQQFVSAVLTLRLAERKTETDPEGAARLRGTALEQAQQGIADLRELAAGIHPGILTDRGLGPAVEALASRLPVPVTVDAALGERLPSPVEASVYFFVSEALTNAAKHAEAGEVRVAIAAADGHLTVDVADDGVGGAAGTAAGTGLAGLADRVAALDGELTITSPPGGGTRLHAVIPLG